MHCTPQNPTRFGGKREVPRIRGDSRDTGMLTQRTSEAIMSTLGFRLSCVWGQVTSSLLFECHARPVPKNL